MILIDFIRKYLEQNQYKNLLKEHITQYNYSYQIIYKKYHDSDIIYEHELGNCNLRFLNRAVIVFINGRYDDYIILDRADVENSDNSYLILKYGKDLLKEIGWYHD